MKHFFALLLTICCLLPAAYSQTATADKLKMTSARMKYNEQDYNGALRIYREEFAKAPDDAMLNYRMGEAHFALKENELALEKFNAAEKLNNAVDVDLYLYLGKINQALANLDKALEQYEKYRAQDLKKPQMEEINTLIAQVKTAQELLARPVNVVISNPGTPINSKFNDYHPSLTADQKVMVFTSRRGEGKVVGVDANDQGFYEDVYITFWNDTIHDWEDAVMAPGAINGVEHDACLSISPDGKQIFMYKNENGGDIYVSKKSTSEKWSSAKPVEGINSSYWESYASLSADGKHLYFCSERKGGQGNGDIWVSKRISKNEWDKPVNLGAIVNSEDDEISVFAHPDGKTLFFSSKGHMNMGGYDIFKTVKNEKGEWSQPENMGYPINSLGDDIDFVLNTETGRAYFSSIRPDGEGEFDIYEIDMSNYGLKSGDVKEKSNLSILKGEVMSAHDAQKLSVTIKITNKNTGKAETEIQSDEEGNYFIMLPGKNAYELTVDYEGYKPYKLSVDLPLGAHEVATTIKPIVLERVQ
ncbi:MAG: hypothetical protein AB7G44_10300 [Bacteroidia bacterium]